MGEVTDRRGWEPGGVTGARSPAGRVGPAASQRVTACSWQPSSIVTVTKIAAAGIAPGPLGRDPGGRQVASAGRWSVSLSALQTNLACVEGDVAAEVAADAGDRILRDVWVGPSCV